MGGQFLSPNELKLTKLERSILGPCIRGLINTQKNAWSRLERAMFDYGLQEYYAAEEDFHEPARQRVFALSQDLKENLIAEWKRMPRFIDRKTDDEILKQYALVVVAGVVAKAWIAQKQYSPERSDRESFDLGV